MCTPAHVVRIKEQLKAQLKTKQTKKNPPPKKVEGTSLAVQSLRFLLPAQGAQFLSLAGELKSHVPCSQNTKTETVLEQMQ